MTKGEQTRQEIIRKAASLFNQKGFEGTSLSDLMDATGLQKGGIYRHFSSKEELAAEAFDYAWQTAVNRRLDGLEQVPDAVDRLKKMVANFVERRDGLVPGGCPLLNTAVEADDGNPLLRARARKALQAWTTRLSKVISEGIKKREIRPGIDALKLSQRIIGSLEGALLISRLTKSDEPLHEVREILDEYVERNVRGVRARSKRASARSN
jgi:TetR/AcrR family transcriptional regulator, transcriptional repressor for nem operon